MGTNFYGYQRGVFPVRIVIESVEDIERARRQLDELEPIHLGKRSMGWEFLAAWNDGKFYSNEAEYYVFCETVDIYDEYGTSYTFEEFKGVIEAQRGGYRHTKGREYWGGVVLYGEPGSLTFMGGEFS